jgi:hypothetical protein
MPVHGAEQPAVSLLLLLLLVIHTGLVCARLSPRLQAIEVLGLILVYKRKCLRSSTHNTVPFQFVSQFSNIFSMFSPLRAVRLGGW